MMPCRAKDGDSQLASNWRLVQVQQQYAVTFTLPLTLPAASLAAAQTQADTLVANNTALADAVTVGLISGMQSWLHSMLLPYGPSERAVLAPDSNHLHCSLDSQAGLNGCVRSHLSSSVQQLHHIGTSSGHMP